MRSLFRISTVVGLAAGLLLVAPLALRAEPAPKAPKAKPGAKPGAKPKLDTERLKQDLESSDEARVLAALAELAGVQGEERPLAAELTGAVLLRGGSVKVLTQALETAGTLAQPTSTPEVAPYVRHRKDEVRRAAVRALTQTGGPEAVASLRAALHGKDQALRGLSASGLGTLKAKEAVPDLFAVLPRQVPEAASAIGELCGVDDCRRFVDLLGKLPFDLMESGLAPVLLRLDADLTDEFKIDVIERLRKLQTEGATTLLKTVLSTFPANGSNKVRAALIAASQGRAVQKVEP